MNIATIGCNYMYMYMCNLRVCSGCYPYSRLIDTSKIDQKFTQTLTRTLETIFQFSVDIVLPGD